jgi:hypothetical protein
MPSTDSTPRMAPAGRAPGSAPRVPRRVAEDTGRSASRPRTARRAAPAPRCPWSGGRRRGGTAPPSRARAAAARRRRAPPRCAAPGAARARPGRVGRGRRPRAWRRGRASAGRHLHRQRRRRAGRRRPFARRRVLQRLRQLRAGREQAVDRIAQQRELFAQGRSRRCCSPPATPTRHPWHRPRACVPARSRPGRSGPGVRFVVDPAVPRSSRQAWRTASSRGVGAGPSRAWAQKNSRSCARRSDGSSWRRDSGATAPAAARPCAWCARRPAAADRRPRPRRRRRPVATAGGTAGVRPRPVRRTGSTARVHAEASARRISRSTMASIVPREASSAARGATPGSERQVAPGEVGLPQVGRVHAIGAGQLLHGAYCGNRSTGAMRLAGQQAPR